MKNEHFEDLCVITGRSRIIGSAIANKYCKGGRNVLTVSREEIDYPRLREIELSEKREIH